MNELLQKHGCSNVFSIPDGLRELMADISREVLREQPVQICDFIANYLSCLLITREHGVMAVKILDDLCDCRPSVSEHLILLGMPGSETRVLSEIINEEIKNVQLVEGKEKVKEAEILKRILKRNPLDEEMTAKVCQIARNAYRDYWYRKKMLEQNLKVHPDEPWEVAAQHTLEIYKRTKPSFSDLTRATQKIQAAYRGYHVRTQMLGSMKPKKPQAPKVDLLGPPVDIAESREIDLGLVVDINDQVKVDDMSIRFTEDDHQKLGIGYDTMKTITHEVETPDEDLDTVSKKSMVGLEAPSKKSMMGMEAPSKKSMMGMEKLPKKSITGVPADAYRKSDVDELPRPPSETVEQVAHIKFGAEERVEVEEIPDIAPPPDYPTGETPTESEQATPTFDIELSSATATSEPTTAPTSDIEDLATSGTDGEAEEE